MEQFDLKKYAEEANKIWNNRYEYVATKRNEKNNRLMVGIWCKEKDKYGREHGIFWKTPSKHKAGQGCPFCSKRFHMDSKYLIETSKLCHNSKFDNLTYEKTEFINYETNVIVTCRNKNDDGTEHGDFPIKPGHLLNGQGCPICRYIKSKHSKRKSYLETINEIKKIHPDYDYSKSEESYVDRGTGMTVICHKKDKYGNEHGPFSMIPSNTLNPLLHNGCPKCGREKCNKARMITFEKFITKAKEVHGDRYIYDEKNIMSRDEDEKIIITCPIHGDFKQTVSNHLFGQGCPICKESRLEREIRLFLLNKNEEFIQQYNIKWLGRQTLDFYLPKYNVGIECQGKQHFGIGCWSNEGFEIIEKRDKIKKKLCEENNVKLLYYSNLGIEYPYPVFEDKEELLNEILK